MHNYNSEDDEEDGWITDSEEKESITLSKNENDTNDYQNYPKKINQEDKRQEDELEDEYRE